MSTLFLVGNVDRVRVKELFVRYRDVFDRTVEVEDVRSLFDRLYSDRLAACALEASEAAEDRWNYEEGVSLVVLESRAEVEPQVLDEMFRNFLPVFNLVSVCQDVDLKHLQKILERLPSEQVECCDRIRRMAHWMYYCPSKGCSSRIYSMVEQLQRVRRKGRRSIPGLIKNIDFNKLMVIPSELNRENYWRLLCTWAFQPHTLTTRELLYCAFILLQKLSADAGLVIPDNQLLLLLFTLEASYHQVNKFHNFKHAVDVMQATWQLCEHIVDDPMQTLLLSMAAIGHDIGHPGSNNMLLSKFGAPVARIYNEESVLENMHKDFFQELLSTHWQELLTISSSSKAHPNYDVISETILATDMALHADYVEKLKKIPKIADTNTLTSLIIKAADISNVTRPLEISAQWSCLITLEFNDCTLLQQHEENVVSRECNDDDESIHSDDEIYRCISNVRLLSPDDLVAIYPCIPRGQIFFIDTFAEQFFQELCEKIPHLEFLIENIRTNKKFWLEKLRTSPSKHN